LDLEFNSFRLDLQFKDQLGSALSGLHVEAYMDGVNTITSFYTDNEGKATLINFPASKLLLIKTFFECDTASKMLDPVTASNQAAKRAIGWLLAGEAVLKGLSRNRSAFRMKFAEAFH